MVRWSRGSTNIEVRTYVKDVCRGQRRVVVRGRRSAWRTFWPGCGSCCRFPKSRARRPGCLRVCAWDFEHPGCPCSCARPPVLSCTPVHGREGAASERRRLGVNSLVSDVTAPHGWFSPQRVQRTSGIRARGFGNRHCRPSTPPTDRGRCLSRSRPVTVQPRSRSSFRSWGSPASATRSSLTEALTSWVARRCRRCAQAPVPSPGAAASSGGTCLSSSGSRTSWRGASSNGTVDGVAGVGRLTQRR